jgi:hypothetical protein
LITLGDYKDKKGYMVEVKTVTEQQDEQVNAIELIAPLKMEMPDNIPLRDIYRRKLMELNKFSPEEISQIEEFEKQKTTMPSGGIDPAMMGTPAPAGATVPQGGQSTLPEVPDIVAR